MFEQSTTLPSLVGPNLVLSVLYLRNLLPETNCQISGGTKVLSTWTGRRRRVSERESDNCSIKAIVWRGRCSICPAVSCASSGMGRACTSVSALPWIFGLPSVR